MVLRIRFAQRMGVRLYRKAVGLSYVLSASYGSGLLYQVAKKAAGKVPTACTKKAPAFAKAQSIDHA